MTTSARNIMFNVDVDAGIFAQIMSLDLEGFPTPDRHFGNAIELAKDLKTATAVIWLFFNRQPDRTSQPVLDSVYRLAEIGQALRSLQATSHAMAVYLVDCSERPADPMSEFGVLARYLDAISEQLPAETPSVIYALDYDLDHDASELLRDVRLWDTRDQEFEDHALRCYRDALRTLNIGFGSDPVPPVPIKD